MNLNILNNLGLTTEEFAFIKEANTPVTADINQSRIISEIYFAKKIEQVADKIILSNEKLAESNNKYAKRMLGLTAALVFVGLVQAFVALVN
jgi:hypothetical protein